jgi:hypothetical protein
MRQAVQAMGRAEAGSHVTPPSTHVKACLVLYGQHPLFCMANTPCIPCVQALQGSMTWSWQTLLSSQSLRFSTIRSTHFSFPPSMQWRMGRPCAVCGRGQTA